MLAPNSCSVKVLISASAVRIFFLRGDLPVLVMSSLAAASIGFHARRWHWPLRCEVSRLWRRYPGHLLQVRPGRRQLLERWKVGLVSDPIKGSAVFDGQACASCSVSASSRATSKVSSRAWVISTSWVMRPYSAEVALTPLVRLFRKLSSDSEGRFRCRRLQGHCSFAAKSPVER